MFNNLGFNSSRFLVRRSPRLRRPAFAPSIGGPGNDIITFNGGGSGAQGVQGTTGAQGVQGTTGGLVVPVTIANTSPYYALSTDYDIAVTANAVVPASVVLPVSVTGKVFIVKDAAGVAAISPITVTATASTIDGAASAIINTNYGSLTFVFDGIEWNIT